MAFLRFPGRALVCFFACSCACAPVEQPSAPGASSSAAERIAYEAPPAPRRSPSPPQPDMDAGSAPPLVAASGEGAVALVDPTTGEVVATSATARPTRDLAYDRFARRLVTFEPDEEESSGEVATYAVAPIGAPLALGPRAVLGWIEGRGRVAPVPAGVVLLGQGYADSWRLLVAPGSFAPSVLAPAPASLWSDPHDGTLLVALGDLGGERVVARAPTGAFGVAAPEITWLGAGTAAAVEARALAWGTSVLVVTRDAEGLALTRIDDGGETPLAAWSHATTSLLAAQRSDESAEAAWLAVLLDGPPTLLVARVLASGAVKYRCERALEHALGSAGDGLAERALIMWRDHVLVAGRDTLDTFAVAADAHGCELALEHTAAGLGAPAVGLR